MNKKHKLEISAFYDLYKKEKGAENESNNASEKTEKPKKWVDNYEDYQNASNNITFSDYPYYRGKE